MIHSWHIFLLIISLPSLLAGTLAHFLPESPKFLMSRGRNSAALEVFQEIYRRNHNPGEFPIKSLADEKYVHPIKSSQATVVVVATTFPKAAPYDSGMRQAQSPVGSTTRPSYQLDAETPGGEANKKGHMIVFKEGISQMMTIFQPQYLRNCLLVFTIQFGFLWSQNTLRLWLPSLLSMVTDYESSHQDVAHQFDMCQVIESSSSPAVSSWNNTDKVGDPEPVVVCSQVI